MDTARALGADSLRVSAAAKLALGEFTTRRTAAAVTHLDEAVAVLDGMDDRSLAAHLDPVYSVALAEAFLLERFDDAIRHAERGAQLCRATGQAQFLLPLLMAQAWSMTQRGRLARALELAQEAVEANRVTGNDYGLMATLVILSRAAFESGDLPTALATSEEAYEITRRIDAGVFGPFCGVALGRSLVAAGRAERAREVILTSSGGVQLPALTRFGRCDAFAVLTDAELALHDTGAAARWAEEAQKLVEGHPLAVEAATVDRALAAVMLAQNNNGAAGVLALAAAEMAESAGARIEAGRLRILAVRALARAGERERAIAECERAEADMAACGAVRYTAEATAELERLDRSHARGRSIPAGLGELSERERTVSELVSRGLTNREIAAELYLSLKTVERHVSHIFDKLGVSTRAAVAGLVASRSGR